MVLLPSQRCGYGFPEVLASLTSGRVVVSGGGPARWLRLPPALDAYEWYGRGLRWC